MEKELVSILIPVYNRVTLVGETIESAIKQTYQNIEIIVVDNCSTDGTWELLQGFKTKDKRIRIFRNDENIGPVKNWERCINYSIGEYIKILWSDDLIDNTYISKCISYIDNNTAFIITNIKIVNENRKIVGENRILKFGKRKINSEVYIKNMLIYNQNKFPVSPGCAFFRKKDIENSIIPNIPNNDNLNSLNTGAGTDMLIFLLTALKYRKVGILNEPLSIFRIHKNSISESFGPKLFLAYDWARLYYLQNYRQDLIKEFKFIISKRHEEFKLYENIEKEITCSHEYPAIEAIKYYYRMIYWKIILV